MNLLGKHILFSAALAAAVLWLAPGPASAATPSGPVPCKDGTTAAHGGRGACRGHGGVDRAAMRARMSSTPGMAVPGTAATAAASGPVLCKDGSMAAHGGRGACRGHGGIDRSARAMNEGSGMAGPGNASAPSRTRLAEAEQQRATPRAQPAPGGGPGRVWVNTQSKVYHCPSDRWYGRTQQGQYMTQAEAQALGYRPDHNKACP